MLLSPQILARVGPAATAGGGGGGSPTTWNPSDKSAGITLSAGNLTYTGNGAARSTNPLSAGKAYWEVLINQDSSEAGSSWNLGFADGVSAFSTIQSTGVINLVLLVNGNIANGSGASVGASIANGNTLCIAVDFGAKKAWFRKNGGNWNNSGTNDPATGVGGVSFGPSGPYYAVAASSNGATSYTANFGASTFSFTKPSGFTSWDGLV